MQGGTRSGKTFSAIYFLIDVCLNYSPIEIDIVRDTFTALKATTWKDFLFILNEMEIYNPKYHNKTDHIYELNGNRINYYGADTPDKIHGRSRDILWINEAHQFPKEIIDQLLPRTRRRVIADYNPALGLSHWLDEYIAKYPPLITTYTDNPFLTKEQIADIEGRKGNAYWWQVYGCGERAIVEGAVFTKWSKGQFDNSLPYCYGQDYGFSKDPTTLIKVAVDDKLKKIYLQEKYYKVSQIGTNEIYEINKAHIEKPNDVIIADSAEQRLISDLSRMRLNIYACEKGQGSVTAGITKMQDYEIVIFDSPNIENELSKYAWNDKKAGIPIDDYNHAIDAARYAFTWLTKKTTTKGKTYANEGFDIWQ